MNFFGKKADNQAGKRDVGEGSTQPLHSAVETMRAITWEGKEKVKCSEVPKPEITHPDDVIVKVTACTICSGSDSHIFGKEIPAVDAGSIMGHEACGTVYQTGSNVSKFNIGDRVVIAFDIACGQCAFCHRGEFSGCDVTNDSKLTEDSYGGAHSAIFGYSRLLGNVPGSQAEFVRVPFAEVNCFPIPEDVPDEKALYVSDVLCTSLHAVDMGEVQIGEIVVIWGLGPIGLYAARWAQIKGAKRVIGVDMVPERLSLAKISFGVEVLDRSQLDSDGVVARLQELIPGGADVVIEAVGFRFPASMKHKVQRAVGMETDAPDILTEAMKVVRKYGRVSIVGDYIGVANQFPIGMIMMKHLTVRSGQTPCQKYFQEVMDAVQSGEVDPTLMVTHRITLEQAPEAYGKLFNQADGYIKVFINPHMTL